MYLFSLENVFINTACFTKCEIYRKRLRQQILNFSSGDLELSCPHLCKVWLRYFGLFWIYSWTTDLTILLGGDCFFCNSRLWGQSRQAVAPKPCIKAFVHRPRYCFPLPHSSPGGGGGGGGGALSWALSCPHLCKVWLRYFGLFWIYSGLIRVTKSQGAMSAYLSSFDAEGHGLKQSTRLVTTC